jgi:uncharacterized protein (TIGR03083 family)
MNTPDFIAALEAESARCVDALRATDLAAAVPSCPDWTGADLTWHLAEVQHFWGAIVAGLLDDPEKVERFDRPPESELVDLLAAKTEALVAALHERSPQERCWSWHSDGGSIAWVARRQAHEALIHRVDAELVASRPVTAAEVVLATDGVAEMLQFFMSGLPEWANFDPDGTAIALESTDGSARWVVEFGRFTGTSPNTGTVYDDEDARLGPDGRSVDTTIAGTSWQLDLWLWGRASPDGLTVSGQEDLVTRLRSVAVHATQ